VGRVEREHFEEIEQFTAHEDVEVRRVPQANAEERLQHPRRPGVVAPK
jgi:hypothetical protein